MKMYSFKFLVAVLATLYMQQAAAYIYSFSNHGADPLLVRVKLDLSDWVNKLVPANKTVEFIWVPWLHAREKEGMDIFKAGLCLNSIQVAMPLKKRIKAVTADGEDLGFLDEYEKDAEGNVKFGAWANVIPKFVQNEGTNAIIRASESFVNGLQDIASSVAKAVGKAE